MTHPTISILMIVDKGSTAFSSFVTYLEMIPHLKLSILEEIPDDVSGFEVIVTASNAHFSKPPSHLLDFVRNGGAWFSRISDPHTPLPELFGVQPAILGPESELRILFKSADCRLAHRLPDAIYVEDGGYFLEASGSDAEIILYADWHYQHKPVLVNRAYGAGKTACTTLKAWDHPQLQQIFYRVMADLSGKLPFRESIGVGLLGYPPWLGRYHGTGIQNTLGLTLEAACDINSVRSQAARNVFPDIRIHASNEAMTDDDRVDLVIVATPPNTHCRLTLQVLEAGRHVICEKPLALTRQEAEQMAAKAGEQKVHLSCHQNRRWDADYLAIRQSMKLGLIGDLFHVETFVGGFHHPCGYWHSHAPVSGGLTYDWGAHYLDWIVSLIPDDPNSVTCSRQKRVWHDVTNADQECVRIRFKGDQEAEFMHSDIAAALKPKWYLLGTKGAIVGNWRKTASLVSDSIHYYREEPIPATEMPPELILWRRERDGAIAGQRMVLPQRQPFGFHRNLADHLLTGEPLSAPLKDSMTVVAILEAAARSAERGGSPEKVHG